MMIGVEGGSLLMGCSSNGPGIASGIITLMQILAKGYFGLFYRGPTFNSNFIYIWVVYRYTPACDHISDPH